ncbi:MAG: hypothetical protein LBH90_02080 [Tannerella sp.]|nr:hypothetical protein [Tannerella sp.]
MPRARDCSGKSDRRAEWGLRLNVLPGTLPFTVLNVFALKARTIGMVRMRTIGMVKCVPLEW